MKGCRLSLLNLKPRAEGTLQPDGPPPEFLESDCPLPCPCNHPLQEGVVLERTSGSKERGSQHPRDPGIDRGTGKQCQAEMEKSRSSDLKVLCVPGHWSAGKTQSALEVKQQNGVSCPNLAFLSSETVASYLQRHF